MERVVDTHGDRPDRALLAEQRLGALDLLGQPADDDLLLRVMQRDSQTLAGRIDLGADLLHLRERQPQHGAQRAALLRPAHELGALVHDAEQVEKGEDPGGIERGELPQAVPHHDVGARAVARQQGIVGKVHGGDGELRVLRLLELGVACGQTEAADVAPGRCGSGLKHLADGVGILAQLAEHSGLLRSLTGEQKTGIHVAISPLFIMNCDICPQIELSQSGSSRICSSTAAILTVASA